MTSTTFNGLNFFATDIKERVSYHENPEHRNQFVEPMTIPQVVDKIAKEFPDRAALMQKNAAYGTWMATTYDEYKMKIEKIAKAFIKLGLERYGVVAILAFNSVEWFISEMAAIHAGGVATGIYTTNSAEAVFYILEHSKAEVVVVDEVHQLNKILQIKDKLKHLKAIIQIAPQFSQKFKSQHACYYQWNDLESMDTNDLNDEYHKRLKSLVPNECCSIVYTSGTTGNPKAAMMSHDNFVFMSEAMRRHLTMLERGCESIISYLPLSHLAGKGIDLYYALWIAATIYFADKDALKGSLVKTLIEVRPTGFASVPRVYEKIQEKMTEAAAQVSSLKRSLASWAKSVTLQHHMDCIDGHHAVSCQYKIANTLILSKIKKAIGLDRVKYMGVGAAPVRVETKKFFYSLDMPLIDNFGLTESTLAVCVSTMHSKYFDSVGKVLNGLQVKISNPNPETGVGEICFNGRTAFMGYLNDLEKTMEVFDEYGWIKTGDLGYINEEGYVFVTGRIKELIITAGGENIPPNHVEDLVKAQCPAISNAFLIGDKRKYLTMLISLKTNVDADGTPLDELSPESLAFMGSLELKYTNLSQILDGPDATVSKAIEEAIERANGNSISNAQKVQKFSFLPHDFSLPTGEFGPTMKVKRHFVHEKYKEIIEEMYK